jgi:shikimate kinase
LVFLVGFMGSGKSTVGKALAARLGVPFVDLDEQIELRAGTQIREIFRNYGEARFRRLECDELRRAATTADGVVALGGGAFCSDENQAIVRAAGVSVWLEVPIGVLIRRCSGDPSRPLATGRQEMSRLLEVRRTFYEAADIRVDGDAEVDAVVEEILRRVSLTAV